MFYGDNVRWFTGVVVANNDPARIGRVRVRVFGLHSDSLDDIPESALPWASCLVPTTEDGVSGLGRSPNIKPGAMVFGMYLDGKTSQQPLVLGSIPRIENASELQKGTIGEFPQQDTQIEDQAEKDPDASLIGDTNDEKVFNFLVSKNVKPEVAAVWTACAMFYTDIFPSFDQPFRDRNTTWGFGIFQFKYGQEERYNEIYGGDRYSIAKQLRFFIDDLRSYPDEYNTARLEAGEFGMFTSTKDFVRDYMKAPGGYVFSTSAFEKQDAPEIVKIANNILENYGQ